MIRQKPPAGLGDTSRPDARDATAVRPGKAGRDGAQPAPGAPALSQQDAAEYVRDISRQLATISTSAGLDLLAYLLDMVCIEAELVKARKSDHPKG